MLRFISDKPGKMSNVLFKGNAVDIEEVYEWIGELFNADETSRSLQDEVSKALF